MFYCRKIKRGFVDWSNEKFDENILRQYYFSLLTEPTANIKIFYKKKKRNPFSPIYKENYGDKLLRKINNIL